MASIIPLLRLAAALAAAILIGNWFMTELKRAKLAGKPWYAAYLSLPGILMILAIMLAPVLLWWIRTH